MTNEADLAKHLLDSRVAVEQAAADLNNVLGQIVLENSSLIHPGLIRALDAIQQMSIAAADMALSTGKYVLGVNVDATAADMANGPETPVAS